MRPTIAALLLAVCPLAAHAEGSAEPAAAPPAAPTWSIGAGLGYSSPFGMVRGYGGGGAITSTPIAMVSLERTLRPGLWVTAGVEGLTQRVRSNAPVGSGDATRGDESWLSVTAGLRRALTPTGAPVTVSATGLLGAGYLWSRREQAYSTPYAQRDQVFTVGLSAGLAVERELSPGLALRASTSLASLSWGRSRTERSGLASSSGSRAAAEVVFSPTLELRLAF